MEKEIKTGTPHAFDRASAARAMNRTRWAMALLMAFAVMVAAWRLTRAIHNPRLGGPLGAAFSRQPSAPSPQPPANITAFYRGEIVPLLDAALLRNRQAADRAIESLHQRFNVHRAGVKPFAQDVGGWGTRLGVIGRFATDQWEHLSRGNPSANHIGDYIQEKFRVHILSEQSLQADMADVLRQYSEDLEASRNRLFAEIRLPLHGRQSPIVLDDQGWDRLRCDIAQRVKELNATTPRDSVVTGLASLAGGWAGTQTAEMVIAQLLSGVGTQVGVEAAEAATAAGGGAMTGGTAAGGGAGSLGGPAGTVIGIGVGLVIGSAIDWWASGRLEAHITGQCNAFLDTVEHQIVDGSDKTPGLRASFERAAKLADANQRQAIIDTLVEAAK